jgi:rhodanese-related sulfurtransferase
MSQTVVPAVSADRSFELLKEGALLIDIRELDEWQAGHAPMAVHMPMSSLGSVIAGLDKDVATIFICRSGRRSDTVVGALVGAGYNAINLLGGMQSWQEAGGAVVRDDANPGRVI